MTSLIIFPLIYVPLLFAALFWSSKTTGRSIDWRLLSLYISFLAMGGPIGEIIVGNFYYAVVGHPLWQYQVFPIHNGYTSYYAPVIWGLSGFCLFITQVLLRFGRKYNIYGRSAITMIETISAEALINLSFLALSGSLLFFYTPGELGHVTSLQTLPFYFLLGLVIEKSIKRFVNDWLFFTLMFCGIIFTTVYLSSQ